MSRRPKLSELKFNSVDFGHFPGAQVHYGALTYLQERVLYNGCFILQDFPTWAWYHLKPENPMGQV